MNKGDKTEGFSTPSLPKVNDGNGHYNSFSDTEKNIAFQIELLLNGLSVADAATLLFKVKRVIEDKGIIQTT